MDMCEHKVSANALSTITITYTSLSSSTVAHFAESNAVGGSMITACERTRIFCGGCQ